MRFDYFYGNEAEQFTFYRIPKVLGSLSIVGVKFAKLLCQWLRYKL